MNAKTNQSNHNQNDEDIYCPICGDRTYYATIENRTIKWSMKTQSNDLGICSACATHASKHLIKEVANEHHMTA